MSRPRQMKNSQMNVKLISLVEQHECIWDRKSNHYMDSRYTNAAWKHIAEKMLDPPLNCWNRWMDLHKFYVHNLKRNRELHIDKSNAICKRMAFLNKHSKMIESEEAMCVITRDVVDNYCKLVTKTAVEIIENPRMVERNCNKAFLLSLLPYLKRMSKDSNKKFRDECMKLIQKTMAMPTTTNRSKRTIR